MRVNQLLLTITAFTLAHSITLGAAVLFDVTLPGPPVEIVIALSIVLLAIESLRVQNNEPTYSARYPWLVAFSFGLIHGFGFAGALADIGLPDSAALVSLGLFNLGVEVGQILCVIAIVAGAFAIKKIGEPAFHRARFIGAYLIGIIGTYWTLERLIATFEILGPA